MSTIVQDPIDRTYPPTVQASVWPSAAKWGAIAGVIGCVFTLLMYNLGMMGVNEDGTAASGAPAFVFTTLLYLGLMYTGLKAYRDTENGGFLSVGRGVYWSLAFGLTLAIISAAFTFVFYSVLAPGLIDEIFDAQLDAAVEQGADEASLEATESVMGAMMSPGAFAVFTFIGALIMPLIIGTVVSLFLKRTV